MVADMVFVKASFPTVKYAPQAIKPAHTKTPGITLRARYVQTNAVIPKLTPKAFFIVFPPVDLQVKRLKVLLFNCKFLEQLHQIDTSCYLCQI